MQAGTTPRSWGKTVIHFLPAVDSSSLNNASRFHGSPVIVPSARRWLAGKWADYSINNLYMDEQTDGYTVAHNVLLNSPNIVHENKNGSHMTIMDNGPSPTNAQSTIMNAGIEPAYADIKTLTIPAASF